MPRRIAGSANFGLYASLTKKTKKAFLRLIAAIIYDVVTEELMGTLGAKGLETRRERLGKYQLTAKIWLTDTVIAVQATEFTGPDDDDDEDDRNDPHDICHFEFEPEHGQWRLVQVSGTPLPTTETVNRISAAERGRDTSSITIGSANIPARLTAQVTAQVGATLRGMIAATASYLRRTPPKASSATRVADRHLPIFANYSPRKINNRWQNLYPKAFLNNSFYDQPSEIDMACAIALELLRASDATTSAKDHINAIDLNRTSRAILILLEHDRTLLISLSATEEPTNIIRHVIMESRRKSPIKLRRLLLNLMEFRAESVTTPNLRKTNFAYWKSLIVRPLQNICADTSNLKTIEPLAKRRKADRLRVVCDRRRGALSLLVMT